MKKILYLFCLLAFIACSDDDNDNGNEVDNVMNDFDKPFSTLSSDELITIMEENINSCYNLWDEINSHFNPFYQAFRHYCDINISYQNSLSNALDSLPISEYRPFVGLTFTWNKEKKDLDKAVNAAGFIECFCPSSIEDDSRNDLHVIINRNPVDNSSIARIYKDDILISEEAIKRTRELSYQSLAGGPYEFSLRRVKSGLNYMPSVEVVVKKVDEGSYLYSSNLEGEDHILLIEYNSIRIRVRLKQYMNMLKLQETYLDDWDENSMKLWTELYNANMESVVVFTDRDEKIGEIVTLGFAKYGRLIFGCKMQDGTINEIKLNSILQN